MLDNEILKFKLKNRLNKLKLTDEQKNQLIAEINLLSNVLIDTYLENKNYGTNNN
ncbi:MAG TPA: hypothetical protein PKL13_04160 [bacterium]|nr:hypothetical protein [bacterium]